MGQLSVEHKKFIIEHLSGRVEAYCIILFGSAASLRLRVDSDVDIAFMSEKTFSTYELFMVAQEMAGVLGREVDLIDFQKANTVFQAQIIGNGAILLDNKPMSRQYAFMRALKEYAFLNDERSEILKNLGFTGGTDVDHRHNHQ
ncbi:MAG TPA: nucleotidyltransferase domain-containing protein [Bacilli bacterium]